jgi:hypothetical protein
MLDFPNVKSCHWLFEAEVGQIDAIGLWLACSDAAAENGLHEPCRHMTS